jgi:outer membrane murein-binding lipoprotein Lpp
MTRKGFYCSGLLLAVLAWPLAGRADENQPGAGSLKTENDELRRQIETLEKRVRSLQAEVDESRTAAVAAQMHADAFENRCRKLQEELSRVKTPGILASWPRANQPKTELTADAKPKSGVPQGKITAIGKDGKRVQISIGADAGIKEGQSLEVFRLGSATTGKRAIYLGTMKLIRVDAEAALGEFKSAPGNDYRPKVGDEVASELLVK